MADKRQLVIGGHDGFTPHIGDLVGMMEYVRATTLQAVDGLSMVELDHLADAESNSIGALLAHIAAVESYYQAASFEQRDFTDAERERWGVAVQLGPHTRKAIRGRPLEHYLTDLAEVRSRTLAMLAERDDAWLAETVELPWARLNNHFMWFHVFEDELNHRGQIRWLRKRLPANR
ncbi:MAG TPA: DUF664 domain-containing protein [Gemmatimonadaceae bacterium]